MRTTTFLVAVVGLAAVTTDAQAQMVRGRRVAQPMMTMPMQGSGPMYVMPGSSFSTTLPMTYVQPYSGSTMMTGQTLMPVTSTVMPVGYVQPYTSGMMMPYQPVMPFTTAVYTMPATSTTTSSGVVTAAGSSTDSGEVIRTAGTTDTDTKTSETTTGTTTLPTIVLPPYGTMYGRTYYPMQGMGMPYGTTFGGYQPIGMTGYSTFEPMSYVPMSQPARRGLFGRLRR